MNVRRAATASVARRRAVGAGLLAGTFAVGALMLASGANRASAAAVSSGAPRSATKAAASNPLPNTSVTDIRTGKAVPLRSALSGKKPLLVWFWAPH